MCKEIYCVLQPSVLASPSAGAEMRCGLLLTSGLADAVSGKGPVPAASVSLSMALAVATERKVEAGKRMAGAGDTMLGGERKSYRVWRV